MKVLVTGSRGFIGSNLLLRLSELSEYEVICFDKENTQKDLAESLDQADAVVHLAGVNRPDDVNEFSCGNRDLTANLCELIGGKGRHIPLIISSSTQAELSNPYGESKRSGELAAEIFSKKTGNPVNIYRLPGVFGKWCRPNYNSVVATFCHSIANELTIHVNDSNRVLKLVYVDDVVSEFIRALGDVKPGVVRSEVHPIHEISIGDLARQIEAFKHCRDSLEVERVGVGFVRALYATYISYLPPIKFAYDLPKYCDERGVFIEMLKTKDSGQFSFFTAHPGITRGGHYHHTKTEKFLVIRGEARFGFRHILTNEKYEIFTDGNKPQIVETVPGWTHDITNIGKDEMVVMLWANETFDRQKPDTIASKV